MKTTTFVFVCELLMHLLSPTHKWYCADMAMPKAKMEATYNYDVLHKFVQEEKESLGRLCSELVSNCYLILS